MREWLDGDWLNGRWFKNAPREDDWLNGTRLVGSAFALFWGGYWASVLVVKRHHEIARLYDEGEITTELDLWLTMLGVIGGGALVLLVLSIASLRKLQRLASEAWTRSTVVGWFLASAAVGGLVVSSVIASATFGTSHPISREVGFATRPITLGVAVCLLPPMMYFLALRTVATAEVKQSLHGRDAVESVRLWRGLLLRHTSVFSGLLTVIVVATGLRRRALIKLDDPPNIPLEQVLIYGLAFAAVLGLFHLAASSAIRDRADAVLDNYAAIPDSGGPKLPQQIEARTSAEGLILGTGTRQSVENSVAILSPLLTALLGTVLT